MVEILFDALTPEDQLPLARGQASEADKPAVWHIAKPASSSASAGGSQLAETSGPKRPAPMFSPGETATGDKLSAKHAKHLKQNKDKDPAEKQ